MLLSVSRPCTASLAASSQRATQRARAPVALLTRRLPATTAGKAQKRKHTLRSPEGGRTSALGVRSRTTCGVPVLSSLFSSPLFLVPYAVGCFKFFAGYSRTTYVNNLPTKLALAAAWPLLFAVSKAYRDNFSRAFKG